MRADIRIIYEDAKVIVIYKPASLAVQSANVTQPDVCSILRNRLKGGYLGVVHRLDQPVEGLLVFAKDKDTAAVLSADLASGRLKKSYKAVVYGTVTESGSDVCHMRKNDKKMCEIGEGPDFKKAELSYDLVASLGGTSLLDIRIGTGRFHQIRAQMAHLGFPLIGDSKYGSRESIEKTREMNQRFPALCADRLSYFDPLTGEEKVFNVMPENPAFGMYDI